MTKKKKKKKKRSFNIREAPEKDEGNVEGMSMLVVMMTFFGRYPDITEIVEACLAR